MTKVRGRYEVVKADPKKPRSIKNVANVRQDSRDKGRLGTRKPTGKNVANIVGRSAKTGRLRSRPTNLSKFPKPRPTIPTPTGALLALLPVAYEQTTEQQQAGDPNKIDAADFAALRNKKYGGKISYRMTGGQVVDSSYD